MFDHKEYSKNIREFAKFIKNDKNFDFFVVTSHDNPDSDAVSSVIALEYLLNSVGKRVLCVNSDYLPENLGVLDYRNVIKYFDDALQSLNSEFNINDKFCLIILDTNNPQLTGKVANSDFFNRATEILYIDHHLFSDGDKPQNIIDNPEKSSASEIIYDIYKSVNVKIPKSVGDALYAGIMDDTGSFRFAKTTYKTLSIAADLVENGTVPNEIYRLLYENRPIGSLILKKLVLQTLELFENNQIAVISLTKQMLEEAGVAYSQTGDLSNEPLSCGEVKVVLFFKENELGKRKVAMRSKNAINIEEIAHAHGGGGHKNAAGFKISNDENLENLKKTLVREISQEINSSFI